MLYFHFADNNEAELAGNRTDWTEVMKAISSGRLLFPLGSEFAPHPFDHIGKRFRVDVVERINESHPVGRFFVDNDSLIFRGTSDDVEWLENQIEALLQCRPGTHLHIDSITFEERLVEETLDLVFHLDGEGWPARNGKALLSIGGKIRNPDTGDHIFPGE